MFASLTRAKGLRPLHRVSKSRYISQEVKVQRNAMLRQVYAPFADLVEGSPEYVRLSESGKVWENYFRPGDRTHLGYDAIQKDHADMLAEIDKFKRLLKPRIGQLAKTLVAEYAHQSVAIENNPLTLGDAFSISDALSETLFKKVHLAALDAADLSQLELPIIASGLGPDESAVVELKNHIVASQWIAEKAVLHPHTPGLDERQMRELAAMTIKGTASEAVYAGSWGGRVPLGGYRKTPIAIRGNPLVIFPYHIEVPACIERFFEWRDAMHTDENVHPLILACHMMVYLVRIHPFPDGNGRVSRMLMHDYLVRQGYLPVIMQNFDRDEYIRAIDHAAKGEPEELVVTMLTTQLDEMQTFYWRQMEGSAAVVT
ncbi:hypothetical protein D7B24_005897 [Verticillium nonalfalfae]|uniref:Fido domain-containing protein n=1 Tax=Verticillium nonalfalfae TaxID=1051616 RepID=A0A3M9XV67_9PEZI|nr:uncharacterized protein D7B24_005897 [Verticillium nonalfalfae]RNJ51921.1 hypothetical protein D7B24_005897 [Verticillium nonalfalfae]